MLETFSATLSPMLVMFSCILIGFILHKSRTVPENTAAVLSKLEVNVFLPALIISSFINNCTMESILSQYKVVLYSCVAVALAIAMGIPLARLFSKEVNERKIYRYSLITANFGFLGNAIVPQILGEEGMYSYILFSLPLNVMLYTWAIHTLVPEGKGQKKSVFKSLLSPTFLALIIGLVLGLTGLGKSMPGFVTTTLNNLAGCMGPVAMILTGFVIGGYDVLELLKNKKVYIATFLRLLVLPAVIIGALWLLGADKLTLILTLFGYGSALGLNTVVIPAAYDGETHTGASMAMISHVGCIITIPLMYALLMQVL